MNLKNLYDLWKNEPECIEIFDFRPRECFDQAHIPGSQWMTEKLFPLDKIETEEGRLFVLIAPENRVLKILKNSGYFDNIALLQENFQEWVDRNYPVRNEND